MFETVYGRDEGSRTGRGFASCFDVNAVGFADIGWESF